MTAPFRSGIVIGKFLPPHAGHHHLIETALARCEQVAVVVFGRSDEPIPLALRQEWLQQEHPAARVVAGMDDHAVDFDDDATWSHWVAATIALLHAGAPDWPAPDAVFAGEPYGAELARRLHATLVPVDPERIVHAVSGTLVRRDPLAAWDHLRPRVRAHFVKRVAVIGAESTGKTTLCRELAEHFGTVWVPEYGRAYSERRGLDGDWRPDEFVAIARQQRRWEDEAAPAADRVLLCDTDALATTVWQEKYAPGTSTAAVAALARPFDLYLVTAPDVPWVDDGLRDGRADRAWMHERFLATLRERGAPHEVLTGSWRERREQAIRLVEGVLASPWPGAAYAPVERGGVRRG